MPAAVIGASHGQVGTAVAQQGLRAVLSFCNARQMTAPEAYFTLMPGLITDDGEVTDDSTAAFLSGTCRSSASPTSGFSRSCPAPRTRRGRAHRWIR